MSSHLNSNRITRPDHSTAAPSATQAAPGCGSMARVTRRVRRLQRLAAGAGVTAAVITGSLIATGAASADTTLPTPITTVPGPAVTVDAAPAAGLTVNGTTLPAPTVAQMTAAPNYTVIYNPPPSHKQHCSILDIIDQSCLPGVPLNGSLGRGFGPGSTNIATVAYGYRVFVGGE
jgi:hypothetical protein